MNRIIGRYHEKNILKEILSSEEAECVAIYGRRRVGKTYLIREFFGDQNIFFELTGLQEGKLTQQLMHFSETFIRVFKPKLPVNSPKTWPEAFEHLKLALDDLHSSKKIILFFDELPWLANRKSGFLSALDHFWNHWASKRSSIKLIVCGSAASWMLDKIVHAKGGLHNRLTRTIRLLPFTLSETRAFIKSRGLAFNDLQVLEIYLAMGGIPHYLKQLKKGESAVQNIDRLCFSKDGILVDEFEKLYASLFENAVTHVKIMKVLAKSLYGMTRDKLLAAAKMSSGGGAQEILRNLEESGFIESFVPFGRKANGKIYRVIDEYSYFYLKWIAHAPASVFKEKNANYWQLKQNSASWKSWAGFAYEGICFKHLDKIKAALGITGVITSHGTWSSYPKGKDDKGCQIDLLLDRADQVISVCEIKYVSGVFTITKAYAEELKYKLFRFREVTKTTKAIFLVLITPHGTSKNDYYHELVNNEVLLSDFFVSA